MIRLFLGSIFSYIISLSIAAQTNQSIFEWKSATEIVTKEKFCPLVRESYTVSPSDPKCKVYTLHSYTVKNQQGDIYTIKLNSVADSNPNRENYDGFSISFLGHHLLTFYTAAPLYNSEYITTGKSKAHFIQVPLDNKSFALLFGGWLYGIDDAPELVIVVVSGNKAKIVFDNYAFAYKYTPSPTFSIEYIDNIEDRVELNLDRRTPAVLKKRTKYKIWKEGNILKYKSWK